MVSCLPFLFLKKNNAACNVFTSTGCFVVCFVCILFVLLFVFLFVLFVCTVRTSHACHSHGQAHCPGLHLSLNVATTSHIWGPRAQAGELLLQVLLPLLGMFCSAGVLLGLPVLTVLSAAAHLAHLRM